MTTRRSTLVSTLLLAAAAAPPLLAATYVLPSDETLADQAPVIAAVRVAGSDLALARAGIATDYLVEVEEVVKGDLPASTIVVRVPGGETAGGLALRVDGAPGFSAGERALLFLAPNRDGSYGVLHLLLGAFHAVRAGGRDVAVRDLSGGRPIGEAVDPPRDFGRFGRWLADRALGIEGERDYLLQGAGPRAQTAAFTALLAPDGLPLRWFRFDHGESAAWKLNPALPAGVGLGAAEAALRAAIAAWNDDATSGVAYAYAGTTGAAGGFAKSDGVNGVLFEDPGNAHVPGGYVCGKGGIVALGVAFFDLATRSSGGRSWHEIVEVDVVTNDGSGCFFRDNPAGAAEVLAHELGHTLGFGHSGEREAAMFGHAKNDGRGARLHHDDRLAAHAAYGLGAPPPQPPAAPKDPPAAPKGGPAAPRDLAGRALGPREIELTWRDLSDDEEGFRLEQKAGKKWREVLALPAGSTGVRLTGLRPGAAATFRLRARGAGGFSGYSNAATVRTPKK